MSKLKLPYSLNISPRRPRLLPTALICLTVLAYLKFTWLAPPAPLVPVVAPDQVSSSSSSNHKSPRILLVSALFRLEHAKHSHDDYTSWLKNFIGPKGVQCDTYIYTTPDLEQLIRSVGSSSPSTTYRFTVNTTYHSPFAVPPLSRHRDKYNQMHAWDRERSRHSPELYAVWNSKPWLLEHAVTGDVHQYDYAFWVDAGSFRAAHPFRTWPDPTRVREVLTFHKKREMEDRVLFPLFMLPGRKQYAWRVDQGPVDMDFSEGSFFGSTPSGISWFAKVFYEAHDRYINASPPNTSRGHHPHAKPDDPIPPSTPQFHFVGKDQTIFNALLFRYPTRFLGILSPSRVFLLPPPPTLDVQERPPYALTLTSIIARAAAEISRVFGHGRACGDWFYYQWWLATQDERERARGMGWKRCGEDGTVVVRIEGLLRGLFGSRWVEGRRAGGG